MANYFINSSTIIQSLISTTIMWLFTTLGSSIVFFFKKVPKIVLDSMLSISAGVMIAASFFSLLLPAINSNGNHIFIYIGFLSGSLLLILGDYIFDKLLIKKNKQLHKYKRNIMLFLSITIHNIPEGLAVGVAFGSIGLFNNASIISAFMLALGVAIQNFPEGCAISLPLCRDKISPFKSFLFGSISGIVEPISGVIGCILVTFVKGILPFFLSLAAGAMIYVAISELIYEALKNNKTFMTFLIMIGFLIMMILDISLG